MAEEVHQLEQMLVIDFGNGDIHSGRLPKIQTYRGTFGSQNIVGKVYTFEQGVSAFDKFNVSPHILLYLGSVERVCQNQKVCVYENYHCNLMEFKDIKQFSKSLLLSGEDAEKLSQFRLTNFLYDENRPSTDFIDMLRQLLEGLVELKEFRSKHGNLTTENVVIILKPGSRLVVKLTGMHQTGNVLLSDYEAFGNIVRTCLENKNMCPEVSDFVHKLVPPKVSETRSINAKAHFGYQPMLLLNHPMFWSADKCVEFYIDMGEFLRVIDEADKKMWGKVKDWFYSDLKQLGLNDWKNKIPNDLLKDPTEYTNSVVGLLKFIRSKAQHVLEDGLIVVGLVEQFPDSFVQYFQKKFPGLLLHAYKKLDQHFPNFVLLTETVKMSKYLTNWRNVAHDVQGVKDEALFDYEELTTGLKL